MDLLCATQSVYTFTTYTFKLTAKGKQHETKKDCEQLTDCLGFILLITCQYLWHAKRE